MQNNKIYSWKRYWTLCDNDRDKTYSFLNQTYYQEVNLELKDLRDKQCLILLGDAALGKSTCLKQERDLLIKENIPVFSINLKEISGESWLDKKFENLKNLTKKYSKVYFLVDSFDEGQISFRNLVNSFVERLQQLDFKRIYLRITCRTVVFPQYLYVSLKKIGIDTQIYKLQPLNSDDIDIVLEENNINKKDFYSNVSISEELKTPITALYIISEYPQICNLSQYEIYEKLCFKLCEEYNGPNNKQVLTNIERLNIVSVIFTLMLFTNKYIISYDKNVTEFDNEKILYIQKYFKDLKNVSDILKFSIPSGNITEVLNTGLFTGEYNRISCIQKTYLEFLAAKFIYENDLYSSFKNLIFDEYNKVLPFFINTVCWLAEKDDDIFAEILTKDPDILLTSIVSFSSEEKNIKLLQKTFELVGTEIYGFYSYERIFRKLNISQQYIIDFIKPYILSEDSFIISLSITLLDINKITNFNEKIFEIAISSNYSFNCRINALYFLKQNAPDIFIKISDYIDNFIVDDREESSRYAYTIINSFLPNNLSEENFLKLISQDLLDCFYYHVVPENIIQNNKFHKILIDKLIEPFMQDYHQENGSCIQLLKPLIENLTIDDIDYYSNLLYKMINCMYLFNTKNYLYNKIKELNKKEKYKFFDYYFGKFSSDKLYVSHYCFFFNYNDTPFLFNQLFGTDDKNFKNFIYSLIKITSVFSPIYRKIEYFKDIIKDVLTSLKNREITYHEYTLKNFIHKIEISFNNIKNIFRNFYFKISKKRPIDNLRKILNKKPVNYVCIDWNNSIWNLSYIKNNKNKTFSICPLDIEYTKEYNLLNKNEQDSLLDLAKFYIQNNAYNKDLINNRLTTNSFKPFSDMLIAPAIYMVYKLDKNFLNKIILENDLLKRSLPYLLNYPYDNNYYNELKQCKIELLIYLFQIANEKFIEEISNIIDIKLTVTNNEAYLGFLDDLYEINDDAFNAMLFNKLEIIIQTNISTNAQEDIFCHIAQYLTIKNYNNCIDLFKTIILDEKMPISIRTYSARLLGHFKENLFDTYKNLLENNNEFATEYFNMIAKNSFGIKHSNNSNEIKLNLNSTEYAQFFIILEKYYPSIEDTFPNGLITPRDEISDLRRYTLDKFINSGDLSFFNYIKNNSTIDVKDFWISRTERYFTEKQYKYITIEELICLILNNNRRIIFDNNHLFEVILEALEKIKKEIRENFAYLRVWNECDDNICYPKKETALSDELKRLLLIELNNVIINREVEIQPKIGGYGNQITDLLVECNLNNGNKVSVIIEVKGCWNPDLKSSIETQLLNSYLSDDNNYKYGIYLIGWYWCNKWNENKKGAKRKKIKVENRFSETNINEIIDYFDNQADLLSNSNKKIASVVIDFSIPD